MELNEYFNTGWDPENSEMISGTEKVWKEEKVLLHIQF
jgi:hypothetical protein